MGVTVSNDGSAIRVDTHTPMDLIDGLIGMILQAAMPRQAPPPGGL